jgi:hypothetical protein
MRAATWGVVGSTARVGGTGFFLPDIFQTLHLAAELKVFIFEITRQGMGRFVVNFGWFGQMRNGERPWGVNGKFEMRNGKLVCGRCWMMDFGWWIGGGAAVAGSV